MAEDVGLVAVIDTTKGKIRVNLFGEQTPYTIANFTNLSRRGFYRGIRFHRVIDEFMVQGGCPRGDGTGGPGYQFADEFVKELRHDKPGILSMANAGPDTNGSQFFITHVPTSWLDDHHTVFGAVVGEEDMAVVNSIVQNDTINDVTIEGDVSGLMEKTQSKVDEWNAVLDKR